ncbi:EcsC family protein [Acidipropionibacterium thoenii]|uniref:EcsC family protein n=1 Tax=Acidipropionibacterium thoenii TaxID=1751 RepID=UPI0004179148|nr:EcsC family protein [Acidipropionibacterium thoenii]
MGFGSDIGKALMTQVPSMAPLVAVSLLRSVLSFAIDGAPNLPGARHAASKTLNRKGGDVDSSITYLVGEHVALAGAQGFVSNVGGLMTAVVGIPANISGVAIVQARMVASIAHLRGYDLDDQRVRSAVMTCLLARSEVDQLVSKGDLPSSPMGIATAPVSDPDLEKTVATRILQVLIGQAAGKQVPQFIGRRIPVIGGGIAATADGVTTWNVARYAKTQFPSRRPR